jgi:hypothetical protein
MRGFAVALRPYGSGTRGIGPPCQMRCRARRVQCGECPPCPIRVRWLDGSRQAAMRLLAPAVSRRERGSDGNARARPAERAWRPTPQWAYRSRRPKRHRECQPGDQPVWPRRPTTPGPTTHVSAPSVPRTTTNPRMGEALFGRQELVADAPLHRFRRRSRTHPWAKPCLAGDDLHTHTPLYSFQERSQTHAWAKPCLAGRPTMLVRTQLPETNTSRGRPPGMELPDYPVMATLPTPWGQDGPVLSLPAGSFLDS